jgi:hypothetical protein
VLLESVVLDQLTIDDKRSFRHVAIYDALERVLRDDAVSFLVPAADSSLARDEQVLLLNLAFWDPASLGEVLSERRLTADMVTHNGWHHAGRRALGEHAASAEGLLFVEAIASAFDVYLVGRLLGHAPDSEFLATQVPAMSEAAEASGLAEEDFEALLQRMSDAPEASFESLRQLLFDTSRRLLAADDLQAAATALEASDDHPFAALLHHYEIAGWLLFARAYGATGDGSEPLQAFDAELRAADDPVALLEQRWLTS